MRSRFLVLILIVLFVGLNLFWEYSRPERSSALSEEEYIEETLKHLGYPPYASAGSIFKPIDGEIYLPVRNFYKNQTINPFGVYRNNRFKGYHSGVDIEVDTVDLNRDVPVYSVYRGEVIKVENAAGYGGVVSIRHNFGDRTLAGIYGHLRLGDIRTKEGQKILSGYLIGYLGADYSSETDGERKHLHFGLYKKSGVNILGYVGSRVELADWLDPSVFLRNLEAREATNN